MQQHHIIIALSVVVLLLALNMVRGKGKKQENFAVMFPLVSNMTQAEQQAAMAQPSCSQATAALCQDAKGKDLSLYNNSYLLSNVQSACGANYPVYSACAAQDPSFGNNIPMLLGGTHMNKYGN